MESYFTDSEHSSLAIRNEVSSAAEVSKEFI